ncbi:MAG: amidase family protein [Acetobacteraceae bacterium]
MECRPTCAASPPHGRHTSYGTAGSSRSFGRGVPGSHRRPRTRIACFRALRPQTGPRRCPRRAAPPGPLHGLPLGVKDVLDTADMPSAYGSPIWDGWTATALPTLRATIRRRSTCCRYTLPSAPVDARGGCTGAKPTAYCVRTLTRSIEGGRRLRGDLLNCRACRQAREECRREAPHDRLAGRSRRDGRRGSRLGLIASHRLNGMRSPT